MARFKRVSIIYRIMEVIYTQTKIPSLSLLSFAISVNLNLR